MSKGFCDGPGGTQIQDLPADCLVDILRRVGDAPLPVYSPTIAVANRTPVTHPAQCMLVCKLWHSLATADVTSLTLNLGRTEFSEAQAANLRDRFPNLTALTVSRDSLPYLDPLAGLDRILPQLESLELLAKITRANVTLTIRHLAACRNLRSLTISGAWSLPKPDLRAWLDAIQELPNLTNLRLTIAGAHFADGCARLGAMPNLHDLSLVSHEVPPRSAGRLPDVLRRLDWLDGSLHDPNCDAIGCLSALETLVVANSSSIAALPASLFSLARLVRLEISGMHRLASLPDSLADLHALRVLSITNCRAFETLPQAVGALTNLEELHVEGQLWELPDDGIGRLSRLRILRLVACVFLHELPETFGNLGGSLEQLDVTGCPLLSLPKSVSRLTSLQLCKLQLPTIQALPDGIRHWRSLRALVVKCKKISHLPEGLCHLSSLRELTLARCDSLRELPEGMGGLTALKHLRLRDCPSLRSLPLDIGKLQSLGSLSLVDCGLLESLPESIGELSSLRDLHLTRCGGVKKLPRGVRGLRLLERLECPRSRRPSGMRSGVWVDSDPRGLERSGSDIEWEDDREMDTVRETGGGGSTGPDLLAVRAWVGSMLAFVWAWMITLLKWQCAQGWMRLACRCLRMQGVVLGSRHGRGSVPIMAGGMIETTGKILMKRESMGGRQSCPDLNANGS